MNSDPYRVSRDKSAVSLLRSEIRRIRKQLPSDDKILLDRHVSGLDSLVLMTEYQNFMALQFAKILEKLEAANVLDETINTIQFSGRTSRSIPIDFR